jgi:hypothetical protein
MLGFFGDFGLYIDYMPFTFKFLKEVLAGRKELIPMANVSSFPRLVTCNPI